MFDLIPWRENRELARISDEMDSMFDRFFDGWPFSLSKREGRWMPSVDVTETAKEVVVNAELPGMEPKDIDISLHDGVLTIRGERKHEHEEKEKAFHRIERRYGSFCRAIRLPSEVEPDKVKAAYKDGVLNVRMPKTKQTPVKKIEVKAA